jgi:hypothetical protein
MLRRHFDRLLGLGAAAVFGAPVPGLGDPTELTTPPMPEDPLERIGTADVALVRATRQQIANLARTSGGSGRVAVELATWAEGLLRADASETVRRALLAELAHLHVIAAWCCHDVGAVTRAHWHFGRAVELATQASDTYGTAYALRHAGMMLIERGEPDRALKMLQLGSVHLTTTARDDARVPVLDAWVSRRIGAGAGPARYLRFGPSAGLRSACPGT